MENEEANKEIFGLFQEHFKNCKMYQTKREKELILANEDATVCLCRIPDRIPTLDISEKNMADIADKASISKEIFSKIKPFLPRVIRLVKYDNHAFNFELEGGLWLIVAPNIGEVLPEEKKVV